MFTRPLLLLLPLTSALSLPAPSGPYTVGTTTLLLTDHTRLDPSAPGTSPRLFTVQLYYPTPPTSSPPTSYLPTPLSHDLEHRLSLPPGTLTLSTNSHPNAPLHPTFHGTPIPTVLLTHAFALPRALYTTHSEDLASHGFLVAAIEHPYDSPAALLPNGTVLLLPEPLQHPDELQRLILLDTRVRDTSFAVSALAANLSSYLPGGVLGPLVIVGHGLLGGAQAANVLVEDARVLGGVDLDGVVMGAAQGKGVGQPWLFVAAGKGRLRDDASWEGMWVNLRGWRRALGLVGVKGWGFTDLAVLVQGGRQGVLVRGVVRAFAEMVLRGKGEGVLKGPVKEWPEVLYEG